MLSRMGSFLVVVLVAASVFAQQTPATAMADQSAQLQALVTSSFGEGFKLDPKFSPLAGDFDLDGTQDLAIVTFGHNPMANSNAKNFKVLDPYDSYFGFGDPKITVGFSNFGDGTSHCVLIIHDWHNSTPKAKFVIVNLPFEELATANVPYKKKSLTGLAATEEGGLNAVVYWDGKKYKWEPTEFSNDTSALDK